MGQTVGKQVDRLNENPIIGELRYPDTTEFYTNPIDYIHKRFEARESICQWGFIWAHRILEEVFVRPELDIKWILNTLNKEDLIEIIPESEIDCASLSSDVLKIDKLKELQQMLAKNCIRQEETTADEEILNQKMNGMLLIAEKMWKYASFYLFGANAIDVLAESDRYYELLEEFGGKIRRLKKDINNKLFKQKIHDIKNKFSAILNIFQKVINGSDNFNTRKKRLDSLFYHCEEIIVFIIDVESIIYEQAHFCIDFVSNFLVFHLGMLQIAEENFGLKDYADKRTNCIKFYPILMKSYIDKATSNYVKSIILNYHNHYSQFQEHEEIFNEITGGVIYKVNSPEIHLIWGKTNKKEMENDKMYYSFDDQKLMAANPSFLCSHETPLLCRALRYGVASKLEDLFTDYIKHIDICINLLGRNSKKNQNSFDFVNTDEYEEINQSNSTICSVVDEDISISASQKYHELRVNRLDQLLKESVEVKEIALVELKNLEELYKLKVIDAIKSEEITSETQKLTLKSEFISTLKSSDEFISNINQYLCFSCENKRYFNVVF